ncbi:MAG: TetR/AcrR family transcriptional regulator [Bdellovibrionota bacterium]
MKTKKGEKEKLRQKILETSLEYFKLHGRTGSATDSIMDRAGLTKGALYSHFKSKDDLFSQAILHDLDVLFQKIAGRIATDKERALRDMIEAHLSAETLDNVETSCVLSSLSSDMNRCKESERKLFADKMERLYRQFADALKFHFPNESTAKRIEMAQVLYASLVGAVSTARLQADRKSALKVLRVNRNVLLEQYTSKP